MSSEARQQLFRQILGAASLPPQHTAMLDLLLKLDSESTDDAPESAPLPNAPEERGPRNEAVAEMEAELSDLREMNDTVAAALGACRICWGGDDACAVCRGYGRPGWSTPERRLFQELVIPAVARMRPAQRRQTGPEKTPSRRGDRAHDHDAERARTSMNTEEA